MTMDPYYRADLALVHHLGFGFHADACGPGILKLLEPVQGPGGHVLSYLADAAAIDRALVAIAGALRPGGVLAIDLSDLSWNAARRDATQHSFVHDDWALVTRFSQPAADRFVREMTTFVRNDDGSWRRDDERHDNVLVD